MAVPKADEHEMIQYVPEFRSRGPARGLPLNIMEVANRQSSILSRLSPRHQGSRPIQIFKLEKVFDIFQYLLDKSGSPFSAPDASQRERRIWAERVEPHDHGILH